MNNSDQDTAQFWYVMGDIHGDAANLSRLPELDKAAGLIISGDLTTNGGKGAASAILDEFAKCGKPVHAQVGNMDLAEVNGLLDEKGINLHDSVREIAPDTVIFGVGGSTPTPMNTPTEFSEADYGAWLEEEWQKASRYPHAILISHNPPKNTICDDIGGNVHVGSTAVREFIEKRQPELCVCGHIHEGRGVDRIGRTVVINPGQFGEGGYVRIEKKDGSIKASLEQVGQSVQL